MIQEEMILKQVCHMINLADLYNKLEAGIQALVLRFLLWQRHSLLFLTLAGLASASVPTSLSHSLPTLLLSLSSISPMPYSLFLFLPLTQQPPQTKCLHHQRDSDCHKHPPRVYKHN